MRPSYKFSQGNKNCKKNILKVNSIWVSDIRSWCLVSYGKVRLCFPEVRCIIRMNVYNCYFSLTKQGILEVFIEDTKNTKESEIISRQSLFGDQFQKFLITCTSFPSLLMLCSVFVIELCRVHMLVILNSSTTTWSSCCYLIYTKWLANECLDAKPHHFTWTFIKTSLLISMNNIQKLY